MAAQSYNKLLHICSIMSRDIGLPNLKCTLNKSSRQLTGLFINFLVISRASGGRVAENTPTCMLLISAAMNEGKHVHSWLLSQAT